MNGGFGADFIPGIDNDGADRLTPQTARLRVLNGPAAGREFRLDRMLLSVGRSDPPAVTVDLDLAACELDSEKPVLSRRHAEISWVGETLQIVDLGSANGTSVNAEPLRASGRNQPSPPMALKAGDRIVLANLEMEIVADGA